MATLPSGQSAGPSGMTPRIQYHQDQLTPGLTQRFNQTRFIPKKGFTGVGTLLLCTSIVAYGFTKFIIRQREDNEYRKLRAAERAATLPSLYEFLEKRDSGDQSILQSKQLQKHIAQVKEIQNIKRKEVGLPSVEEEADGKQREHRSRSLISYIPLVGTYRHPLQVPPKSKEQLQKEYESWQEKIFVGVQPKKQTEGEDEE